MPVIRQVLLVSIYDDGGGANRVPVHEAFAFSHASESKSESALESKSKSALGGLHPSRPGPRTKLTWPFEARAAFLSLLHYACSVGSALDIGTYTRSHRRPPRRTPRCWCAQGWLLQRILRGSCAGVVGAAGADRGATVLAGAGRVLCCCASG